MNQYSEIQKRLTTAAAIKLGCSADQLDPAVSALADAMAWELSALQMEAKQSDRRVLKKLTETLCPAFSERRRPVCGMAWAMPRQAEATLSTTQSLEADAPAGSCFFSPLVETKLFKGKVDCVVTRHGVFQQEAAGQRRQFPCSDSSKGIRANEIWLGISLDNGITSPEGITLWLDWEAPQGKTAQVLSMLQATWNGMPIAISTGFPQKATGIPADLAEWQFMQQQVEQPALTRFTLRCLQVGGFLGEKPVDFKATKTVFPHGEAGQPWATEPLHWLRLAFPVPLSDADIAAMPLIINCFPVLNRQWRYKEVHADQPTMVLPLEVGEGEGFLGLHRVFSKSGEFGPAVAPDFNKAKLGCYALQQGSITAFDLREARHQVEHLFRLLRTESASMKLVFQTGPRRNDVQGELENIERSLTELEGRLPKEHPGEPGFFLHLKPLVTGENVFVQYWTVGDGAERGSLLNGIILKSVDIDTAFLASIYNQNPDMP